jgi:uncharacterized protein (DUF362 family)
VFEAVAEAVCLVSNGNPPVWRGNVVVIKPNIFAPRPAPTTTDPRVVAALVRLARDAGAKDVIVAEGRSISTAKYRKSHNTTRECAEFVGMPPAVETAGGRMVYLEEDEFVTVNVEGGLVLRKAHVPRTVLEADVFINVPVLKIHSLTMVTLGIKNLHGILSDEDKLFGHSYRELPTKLTDLIRIRKPDLTVIDGLLGQEGDHAEEGTPVHMGVVIASKDIVAVDAVASAVMGFHPMEIDTTRLADEHGLGEGDLSRIRVVGVPIEDVCYRFARPDIRISSELFPGLQVIAGDYCRSCEYYVRRGLDKLASAGYFDNHREALTIVIGKEPPVPEKLFGKVIIIGDCALQSTSVRRLRDYLLLNGRLQTVYACPPMEFRIRALDMV